jgi:hypothetical protein
MSTREFIRTIWNKIRFLAGITRSKIDAGKDTIGDLYNFQMDEGSLILRNGTRVMNSQEDQLWYDIQSFTISGTKMLIGLNYKRELWAWLDKWPEIDFKLCTSSPYKRYRHVDENGNEFFNRHISFSRGDNFWLDQDAYTIIIMSDQGEIYKIMKQGFVRITKDLDYVEEELDQPVSTLVTESREYDFQIGRIYVDIKDATNRVFEEKLYLPEDTQKKGHRITGEIRAAWVNELGVVSELSDPEYLSEYKHVMASLVPVVARDPDTGYQSFTNVVKPSATTTPATGNRIYRGVYDGGEFKYSLVSTSSVYDVPDYDTDFTEIDDCRAWILVMPEGGEYQFDQTSAVVDIPAGIYMCLKGVDTKATFTTAFGVLNADLTFTSRLPGVSGNEIEIAYIDTGGADVDFDISVTETAIVVTLEKAGGTIVTTAEDIKNGIEDSLAADELITVEYDTGNDGTGVVSVLASTNLAGGLDGTLYSLSDHEYSGEFFECYAERPDAAKQKKIRARIVEKDALPSVRRISASNMDETVIFSENIVIKTAFNNTDGEWLKLNDGVYDLFEEQDYAQIVFSTGNEYFMSWLPFPQIRFKGVASVAEISLAEDALSKVIIGEFNMFGLEFASLTASSTSFGLNCDSFDLWRKGGLVELLSSPEINVSTLSAKIFDSESEYLVDENFPTVFEEMSHRFAIWNGSHIIGVSQRCFYTSDDIQYENANAVTGNYNLVTGGIPFEIGYMPIMRFDYQGRRQIPYPLPLIARAMRNPEKALISAGNIYSLEEGKLWYGFSGDMLLRDSIEFQATVRDMCSFDVGVIAATERGLQFVSKNNYQAVYKGEKIVPDYLATCSGGAIAVQGRKIYLVHKAMTDSGSWYPQVAEIGRQISEVVFEGSLQSVSIGSVIYLADDYNVWGYDLDMKVWSLKYNYDTKIHKLFVFNDKLGLSFDAQIDRKKSFDAPKIGVS